MGLVHLGPRTKALRLFPPLRFFYFREENDESLTNEQQRFQMLWEQWKLATKQFYYLFVWLTDSFCATCAYIRSQDTGYLTPLLLFKFGPVMDAFQFYFYGIFAFIRCRSDRRMTAVTHYMDPQLDLNWPVSVTNAWQLCNIQWILLLF